MQKPGSRVVAFRSYGIDWKLHGPAWIRNSERNAVHDR
jgi:hypothetical protein